MDEKDERELNTCLNSIIQKVAEVIETSKDKQKQPLTSTFAPPPASQQETVDDPLFNNSVQSNNLNTFTVDNDEKELLDTLTNDVQNIL
ncbi:unnamed protein product [Didymodactylos carnosus]|nr:unnamed protein product [Didymodactylos carnosus]CAF3786617.1 unnamed protein product [Didymodactylos carnosus]